MKILALVTDAFGGRGGIAQFNRDTIEALSRSPQVTAITVVPRLVPDNPGPLPSNVRFVTAAAGAKLAYVRAVIRELRRTRYDLVVCAHLNLLPLAVCAQWRQHNHLMLMIYGIEAWRPAGWLRRRLLRGVTSVVSISEFTRQRFLAWAALDPERVRVLPCCIDIGRFGPGPKSPTLLQRYRLEGRIVIMTLARLVGSERYKGFDEVMDVLPRLATVFPDIAYLIVGDGPDRARLERKAQEMGIAERVVFTGYIHEAEKPDHYRIADLFVMPGRGEGFGIVYLEALACGIPVVASSADASRETVLNGALGTVVDPSESESVYRGIASALASRTRVSAAKLEYFSSVQFAARWDDVIASVRGE